jgi:hypothetical protein
LASPAERRPWFHQPRPWSAAGGSRAAQAGRIVRASSSELDRARITVMPMAETNSPAGPGISTIGMKASTVVKVELVSGRNRCAAPSRAASSGARP